MSIQVVLACSAECATELEAMGFEKREVWVCHEVLQSAEGGRRALLRMENPPFQFASAELWGMGPD